MQEGSAEEATGVEGPAGEEAALPSERNLSDPGLYVNREISQLRFFYRVLEEAEDQRVPLLERIKFLAILGSILSEFFMVRVAGLKQQVAAGVTSRSPDGLTPQRAAGGDPADGSGAHGRLACLLPPCPPPAARTRECASSTTRILDRRAEGQGAVVLPEQRLSHPYSSGLRPFPTVPVHLQHESQSRRHSARRGGEGEVRPGEGTQHAASAHTRLGRGRPRAGRERLPGVARAGGRSLPSRAVPGPEHRRAHLFRVTRDADIEIQELEASDLLETVERSRPPPAFRFGGEARDRPADAGLRSSPSWPRTCGSTR